MIASQFNILNHQLNGQPWDNNATLYPEALVSFLHRLQWLEFNHIVGRLR